MARKTKKKAAVTKKTPGKKAARKSPAKSAKTAAATTIRFTATLLRPKATSNGISWTFLKLPTQASRKLRSRGQVTVEGTFNGAVFQATLQPDGESGHWLKVDRKLLGALKKAGVKLPGAGDSVTLEIAAVPPEREPEPDVPTDLHKALAAAPPGGVRRVERHHTRRPEGLDSLDHLRQAGRDARPPNQECLRHARQRQTPAVLLRSLRHVC